MLGKRELYEISGHWSHYRDGMYPPMELGPMELGREQVVLRPSLCPHHALLYRSRGRSYRELPLRLAELGGQYRAELSGVLGGLTRVRAMQLNDAHIFCTLEQAAGEARAALAMIRQALPPAPPTNQCQAQVTNQKSTPQTKHHPHRSQAQIEGTPPTAPAAAGIPNRKIHAQLTRPARQGQGRHPAAANTPRVVLSKSHIGSGNLARRLRIEATYPL